MLSTEELLRKAVLNVTGNPAGETTDFGGAGQAPLSIEQVTTFIALMSAGQVVLPRVRKVTSNAQKWQESIVDLNTRVARPGTEGTRLGSAERKKPTTGIVEISTSLVRAEIPVTDEVMEDNVAGPAFLSTLENLIADRFGYDLEDLFLNGDTLSGDTLLAMFNGWIKQVKTSGAAINAAAYGQDYQEIFRALLETVNVRFLRALQTNGAFYIPKSAEIKYRDILASRGTSLGDLALTQQNTLAYQGIALIGVPAMNQTSTSSILLATDTNLYAGFHRNMRFETYRDGREGITSFLVTARVDAKVAVPTAAAVAYNVDVAV